MFKVISLASLYLFLTSTSAAATEAKTKSVNADEMRCEKLTATPLSDFKASLVENCNLNKPFSSSLSKTLNDEVYFYCCHKK